MAKSKTESVGLFEAKTHLSGLIERVEAGEEITITRRGEAVAKLVPIEEDRVERNRRYVRRMRELRKGVNLGKGVTIRELIEEGRL